MYFVISVFPISMTSGAVLAASVASNFCRWVGQSWYWTLTFQPGWSFSNCAFAAATTSAQPDFASVWSHTVRLFAAFAWVAAGPETAAPAVEAATASAPTTSASQMVRPFMFAPSRVLDGLDSLRLPWPVGVNRPARGLEPTLV